MGYYLDKNGNYYQGDEQPDSVEVPQQPDSTYDWLDGQWIQNVERATPAPDVAGFIKDCKAIFGDIVGENAIARDYPLLFSSVGQLAWDDVQKLLQEAQKTNALSPDQYAAFLAAAKNHNIPLNLP